MKLSKFDRFKSHLTLVLSLVAILSSIFFYRLFREINVEYQLNLVDQSSIVIVSTKPIKQVPLPQYFSSIQPISPAKELARIKTQFPDIDFSKIKLPYFYKLKLKGIASPRSLEAFKEWLLRYPYIKRVLTFTTTQQKIYNLLTIIDYLSTAFMWFSIILGIMLIVKQLEVWKLLHSEQMYVMELFGAPLWLRGSSLFKISLLDSLIALGIVAIEAIVVLTSPLIQGLKEQLQISLQFHLLGELAFLGFVALVVAICSTIVVIRSGIK